MAEAVFSHTVNQRGLGDKFYIDSAGTAGYHVLHIL
jgi:low molecular weight phosphotyrosine protein phosphatase